MDVDAFLRLPPGLFDDFPRSRVPRHRAVCESIEGLSEENNAALLALAGRCLEPEGVLPGGGHPPRPHAGRRRGRERRTVCRNRRFLSRGRVSGGCCRQSRALRGLGPRAGPSAATPSRCSDGRPSRRREWSSTTPTTPPTRRSRRSRPRGRAASAHRRSGRRPALVAGRDGSDRVVGDAGRRCRRGRRGLAPPGRVVVIVSPMFNLRRGIASGIFETRVGTTTEGRRHLDESHHLDDRRRFGVAPPAVRAGADVRSRRARVSARQIRSRTRTTRRRSA
jgi:hypothetical protein